MKLTMYACPPVRKDGCGDSRPTKLTVACTFRTLGWNMPGFRIPAFIPPDAQLVAAAMFPAVAALEDDPTDVCAPRVNLEALDALQHATVREVCAALQGVSLPSSDVTVVEDDAIHKGVEFVWCISPDVVGKCTESTLDDLNLGTDPMVRTDAEKWGEYLAESGARVAICGEVCVLDVWEAMRSASATGATQYVAGSEGRVACTVFPVGQQFMYAGPTSWHLVHRLLEAKCSFHPQLPA